MPCRSNETMQFSCRSNETMQFSCCRSNETMQFHQVGLGCRSNETMQFLQWARIPGMRRRPPNWDNGRYLSVPAGSRYRYDCAISIVAINSATYTHAIEKIASVYAIPATIWPIL